MLFGELHMANTTLLGVLNSISGNPITQKILSGFGFCNICGKNRIEVALELYVGERKKACVKCKLAEGLISSIFKTTGKVVGVKEKTLKEQFRAPYWRKIVVNLFTGIKNFGFQRPFITGAPFLVVWDITYACNLKCKHCYANAGKNHRDELTTDEAKRVIDKLDHASVPIIAFSGGEPLVRKDIFELTDYARNRGMYVAVATNGTLISKGKAREMKEKGIRLVQVSLDGASAETHDSFRGINGVYKKAIQGIKNCVDEGLFVTIATTAMKFNYKEIPKIIDLCEDLGVKWFALFNFVPTGRGEFIEENDLSPFEREQLLNDLWVKVKNGGKVDVFSTAPQFIRVAWENKIGKNEKIVPTQIANLSLPPKYADIAEFFGGCGCGRFYCAIRPNGDIDPCVFFPLTIGNIKEDDFENLWKNNPIIKDLRNKDILEGNCGSCDYRYYCGGCRGRAYSSTGNYLASDPGCIRNSVIH